MGRADEPNMGHDLGAFGQFQDTWVCRHSWIQRCSTHPGITALARVQPAAQCATSGFSWHLAAPETFPGFTSLPASWGLASLTQAMSRLSHPSGSLTALFWPAFLNKRVPCHGVVCTDPLSGCFGRGGVWFSFSIRYPSLQHQGTEEESRNGYQPKRFCFPFLIRGCLVAPALSSEVKES